MKRIANIAILVSILIISGVMDHRVNGQCNHPDDYSELRELYLSTDGDNWYIRTGWPTRAQFMANPNPPVDTDLESWKGIICVGNRVNIISLTTCVQNKKMT